jgi:enolase
MKITRIEAYEIIDNRAMPTIRTRVCVDDRHWGWADVPCGSSTGSFEAKELKDGNHRYRGKGVRQAIENIINKILPTVIGMPAADQRAVDGVMLDLDIQEYCVMPVDCGSFTIAVRTLSEINQIGTLTEAIDAASFARSQGFSIVVSERSGETEDSVLADISVALNAGLLKTGGMHGSDRGAKYNRLIEIERELGKNARYAGRDYRMNFV